MISDQSIESSFEILAIDCRTFENYNITPILNLGIRTIIL